MIAQSPFLQAHGLCKPACARARARARACACAVHVNPTPLPTPNPKPNSNPALQANRPLESSHPFEQLKRLVYLHNTPASVGAEVAGSRLVEEVTH